MPGLLIIAHAPLASSLKAVAEHAYPDCAVPARRARRAAQRRRSRRSRRRRARCSSACAAPELLIFTDVFGATPCNIAQRLADGVRVKVVTGVNVPMLWRTLCYATSRSTRWSRARSPARRRASCRWRRRGPQNQTLQARP